MNKWIKATVVGSGALTLTAVPAAVILGKKTKTEDNTEQQIPTPIQKKYALADEWISQKGYSPKDTNKLVNFSESQNVWYYSMGCHKSIFGGKNYQQLQDTWTDNPPEQSFKQDFQQFLDFESRKNPWVGCSTSYMLGTNYFGFELAMKKGDRGFIERIEMNKNIIWIQIIFYEKNTNPSTSTESPYVYAFGLNGQVQMPDGNLSQYQSMNPQTGSLEPLNIPCTNNCDKRPRHYSIWVEDDSGESYELFEKIGIKNNNKTLSILGSDHFNSSLFGYFEADNTGKLTYKNKQYAWSAFSNWSAKLKAMKGKWESITDFCNSNQDLSGKSMIVEQLIGLAEYCYEKPKNPN